MTLATRFLAKWPFLTLAAGTAVAVALFGGHAPAAAAEDAGAIPAPALDEPAATATPRSRIAAS